MTDAKVELAESCEQATAEQQADLLREAFEATHGPKPPRIPHGSLEMTIWLERFNPFFALLRAKGFLDAAMTLLPASAANIDVFSFSNGWGCRFHDTAQLMGERAAKEEIARVQKGAASGSVLRGPAAVYLEKAIAEHYIEFYCLSAKTPALALCAAALRAKAQEQAHD